MAKKLHLGKWSLGTLAMAAVGLAAAPVVAPPGAEGPQAGPKKPVLVTTKELGGTERFLSYVSTDKPIYRANEKVYARAVLLDAATHRPLADDKQVQAEVQILGPKGETIATGAAQSENSVVGYAWTVPPESAGGEYTFKIKYPAGYAPAERKFDVRIYRAPRLKNQITFAREGYGPGDKVTASVHSERAEGGFPAGAKVTVIARVDDRQVWSGPATIDAKGDTTATFELPKQMERGEGTLAFAIEDGGVVETASKTMPILLQTLDLQIYPEGGDAVADVSLVDRFYFEAKTPAKKPADFVGAIYDSHGLKVADVKTEHEGRGRFEFSTMVGETYTLKISQPAGISKTWNLPAAKNQGVVIRSLSDVVAKGRPVKFRLQAPIVGAYAGTGFKVTLKRREVDVADAIERKFAGGGGRGPQSFDLSFSPGPEVDGVLTLTVWNDRGEPVAERLIYRQPMHEVKVNIKPNQTTYTPGGKVTLDINTTDENGKSIAATVGLTVTDDSVLEMIEKREQAPRLPVMVMLEPEVKELADATIYMDASNPKAALATDLLLGTQGWRRFATVRADQFAAEHGDAARRVLAWVKPEPPELMLEGGGFGGGGAGARLGAVRAPAAPGGLPLPVEAPHAFGVDKEAELKNLGELRQNVKDQDALEADRKMAAPAAAAAAAAVPALQPFAGGGGGGRGRPGFQQQMALMVVVREYAHELRPDWSPKDRSDFTETVYWKAGIKTDESGHATASFALSDAVTSYRVAADAFSKVGSFGTSTATTVQAQQPFFIEPKLPLEVTAGDVIELPVSMKNNTASQLGNLKVTVTGGEGLKIEEPATNRSPAALPAMVSARKMFTITVGDRTGDVDVSIDASAGAFSDHVTRKLRVKPKGFPTSLAYGGLLDAATPAKKQFTVPNSVVANSMKSALTVYPSPAANLTEAVAALLREPNGCFEQTSSTNYPLAMAQNYFMKHQGVDPALAAKGAELLARGYQRLISFECTDKGYEWFGGASPGHEALTAYGLMEFHDMKEAGLATVDDKMIDRTRTWLISRENGAGGFERNARALDSFGGAPELTTNAYIVWALLQAGETPQTLAKQIAAVREAAKGSTDSYVLALAANICALAKDGDGAKYFMGAVAKKQTKDGAVDGAATSITRSGGEALAVETTALSTLAWLGDKEYAGHVQNAIKFLADSCKGGRFGSTQSTILALKAIVAYDQSMAHPKVPGNLTLLIDNSIWGEPVAFTAETTGALTFGDFSDKLSPGPHTVDLRMADGSQMPFSLEVTYNSITPAADKQCKLGLTTRLKDAQLAEGGITEEVVEVANRTDKDAASPVAIIGIPGGLEVRHDQLKELVKAGKVDAYEVRGREVVLYWRQIKAGVKDSVSISLTAGVPGTYEAPASRAYEYYTDEYKQWVAGDSVVIKAK